MVGLQAKLMPRDHANIDRPIIFEYVSSLLTSAQSFSVLLIERAVVGLLRLCLIVSETVSSPGSTLWRLALT